MMMTKITVQKKMVCYEHKQYQLTYSLLSEDNCRYGMEITCRYGNITETEQLWLEERQRDALRLLRLFAKETVFPVALKETYENL